MSLYISHVVSYFYEIEILAGFGTAGRTETFCNSIFEGCFHGQKEFEFLYIAIVASALKS